MTALVHTNTPAAAVVQALHDAVHPGTNLVATLRDTVLELHLVDDPRQLGAAMGRLLDAHAAVEQWFSQVNQTANELDLRDAIHALSIDKQVAA